jgi:hypothetical protein
MGLGYQNLLVTQQAAGTLFNTYTTSKSVINPQATWIMPGGWLYIGKKIRLLIQGAISNRVTGPDTTTFEVKVGPTANIVAFTTGAMILTTTAHTTIPFWCEIDLTCRSVGNGTNATLMGQARVTGQMFQQSGTAAADSLSGCTIMAPNTAPAVGTGFDSTTASILDFWVAQSFSGAGNGIQIQQYAVEEVN